MADGTQADGRARRRVRDRQPQVPLRQRLSPLTPGSRYAAVLDLVRGQTAELLGTEVGAVDPDRAYRDYGYSSLAAVELTNRLGRAADLDLPVTLVFDHPTPAAVARQVLTRLGFDEPVEDVAVVPVTPPSAADPVVVVGLGCRYPGGVVSGAGLWDVVVSGRDVVGGFPVDRGWDVGGLFDPDPDRLGCCYTRWGGFVEGVGGFDAEFFGVSRREALAMDPQQRLLLQVGWEALEGAGCDVVGLRGSDVGVFVGTSGQDYGFLARSGPVELEGYWGIGSAGSVLSGRLAYVLGLTGPALTVDTACSASLVAVHLAVRALRALRAGECSLALAGGVTVMSTPSTFVEFSRQRALSVDGRCKSFARGADGTG